MQTKLGLACVIGCLVMSSSALLVVGCSDEAAKADAAAGAGSGGDSASDGVGGADGSHVGGADSTGDGGRDSLAGGSSTGARPNVDPGHPDEPNNPDEPGAGGSGADSTVFDGVDMSEVPGTAPIGCVGGFDAATGKLSITLDKDLSVVRLAVHAGVVQANGVDCETAKAAPVKADALLTLEVSGGEEADVVYLDLSDGAFSGCFAADGAISIDLGAGMDQVNILGTDAADVFHAGTEKEVLVLDLDGDDRVDVSIDGAPEIVLSTGGKSDEVRADGVDLGVDPAALPLHIYGGGAGDKLVGGAAADQLFGGIGDDWFDAGTAPSGADVFDGGDGKDTVDFSARTAPLFISIGAGADDGEKDEGTDVTDSVENVYGGQAANEIAGSSGPNSIWGGPEADTLLGGAGEDTLSGGEGNDTLKGEAGSDTLYGDDGDDDLDGGADDDSIDAGSGKNSLNGGPGDGDICIFTKPDKVLGCEL